MIIVENKLGGLFDYTVTGERETEAAEELERELDFLARDAHRSGAELLTDLATARQDVERKYGVVIGTTV